MDNDFISNYFIFNHNSCDLRSNFQNIDLNASTLNSLLSFSFLFIFEAVSVYTHVDISFKNGIA